MALLSKIYLITQRLIALGEEENKVSKEGSGAFGGISLRKAMRGALNNYIREDLLKKNKGAVLKSLNDTFLRVEDIQKRFAAIKNDEVEEFQKTEEAKRMLEGPLKSYMQLSERIVGAETKIVEELLEQQKKGLLGKLVLKHRLNVKNRSLETLEFYQKKDLAMCEDILKSCNDILGVWQRINSTFDMMKRNITEIKPQLNRSIFAIEYLAVKGGIEKIFANIRSYENHLGELNEAIIKLTKDANKIRKDMEKEKELLDVGKGYSGKILNFVLELKAA